MKKSLEERTTGYFTFIKWDFRFRGENIKIRHFDWAHFEKSYVSVGKDDFFGKTISFPLSSYPFFRDRDAFAMRENFRVEFNLYSIVRRDEKAPVDSLGVSYCCGCTRASAFSLWKGCAEPFSPIALIRRSILIFNYLFPSTNNIFLEAITLCYLTRRWRQSLDFKRDNFNWLLMSVTWGHDRKVLANFVSTFREAENQIFPPANEECLSFCLEMWNLTFDK